MRRVELKSRGDSWHDALILYAIARSGGPSGIDLAQIELDLHLVRLLRVDRDGESIEGRSINNIPFKDSIDLTEEQWARLCAKYQAYRWAEVLEEISELFQNLKQAAYFAAEK